MRKITVAIAFAAAILFSVIPQSWAVCVPETVINTNDSGIGSLRAAINAVNNGGCSSIVWVPTAGGTISLASALPVITANITINAGGTFVPVTIDGQNQNRIFFVGDGTTNINVSINNLSVVNGLSQGGKGGDAASAGGGGLGAGAGIFVNSNANVTVSNVTFDNDAAKGGNGGNVTAATTNGGGGGGMDYPGSTANGQDASAPGAFGFGNGGGPNGGAGDRSGNANGGGDFSGGGAGINFPGNGGFGGGGGGSYEHFGGVGGFGGGNGGGNGFIDSQAGSGGSGYGGGIFVRQGGSLTYAGGTIGGNNTVTAGAAGTGGFFGASNGSASGAGLYTMASDVNFSGNTTVASAMTVTGNISQTGPGTLALQTPNTISGNTTVTNGTVQVADQSALGQTGSNANILTLNNGTLQTTTFNNWTHDITLGAGGGTWDTQNSDHELDGVLSGVGSFTKTGNGTLYLTNTNTYQGGTAINGGTLNIQSDANLGQASGIVTLNGGTLQFGADATLTRAFALAGTGGSLDLGNQHMVTLSGPITGSGGLTQDGNGILTLGSANSYTGGTTVTGGILSVSNDNQLGDVSGGLTLTNGGNLVTTSDVTSNRALSLSGLGGGLTSDSNITWNGVISGPGSLTKEGAGILALNRTNTYSGGTYIGNGTVQLGATNALGTGFVSMFNGSSLLFGSNNTTIGSLQDDASGTRVDLGAGTLTTGSDNTTSSYSGTITGTGSLVKEGAGTFFLAGNNSYSGGTTINNGVLSIGSDVALGAPNGPLTLNGGTLQTTGFGNISSIRNVTLGSAGGTIDTSFGTPGLSYALFGTVGGTGDLTKMGSGELELLGNNTYSGATNINEGILSVLSSGGLGNSSGINFNGGTFRSYNTVNFTQAVTLGINGGTVDSFGNTVGLSGPISGQGGLTKVGTGVLALNSSNNSYSGVTNVNEGTLQAGAVNAFSASSAYTVADGAVLDLNNFNQTIGSLSGTGAASVTMGSGNLTTGVDNTDTTFGGDISGSGALIKDGFGTFALTGGNGYSGGTQLNGGVLQISDDSNLGASNGGLTFNGGTLEVSGTSPLFINRSITLQPSGGSIDVDGGQVVTDIGSLSGAGALVKYGAGELSLGGFSDINYSGPLFINEGILSINNGIAPLGTGMVTFDGGTLRSYSPPVFLANAITLDVNGGTFDTFNNNDMTLNGPISGPGGLTKTGIGSLTLGGPSFYQGPTQVQQGTLAAGNFNTFSPISQIQMAAGTEVDLNNFDQTIGSLSSLGGATVSLGNGTLTTGLDGFDASFNGTITGTGGLVKIGPGTQILVGANTYSGGTHVIGGTLMGDTASLQGDIVDDASVVFNQSAGAGGIYSGTLSGNGSVMIEGGNPMALTGNNTYSGGTTVTGNAGVAVASDQNLGTGGLTLNQGGLQTLASLNSSRNITLQNSGAIDTNGFDSTFSGVVDGNGELDKVGQGTLTLTGANTYTGGTYIGGGVLAVNSDANLGNSAGAVELDNATLKFLNNTVTSRMMTLDTGIGTIDANGQTVGLGGDISGLGQLHLADSSGSGTSNVTLGGFNTYTGGTRVDAGVNVNGNTDSLQGTIINNGSVTFNQLADGTYAGSMGGAGSLTKSGAAMLIMAGRNTYSGGTFLNDGTLEVLGQGPSALVALRPFAPGPIGTAFGTGDFTFTNGTLKVDPTHFGTINVGGNYTQSGGTLELKLGGGQSSGILYDQLVVDGTAHFGGTLQLDVVGGTFTPGTGVKLQLVQAGGYAGAFDIVSNGAALGFAFDPTTGSGGQAGTGTVSVTQQSFVPFAATDNQRLLAANVDKFSQTATGDLNTLVAGLDSLSASQLPSAFNELSPQRFEMFSDVAFRTAAFTAQGLTDHLSRLRAGSTGLDMAGMLPGQNHSFEAMLADASTGRAAPEQWDFPTPMLLADAGGGQGNGAGTMLSLSKNLGAFVSGDGIFAKQDATTDLQESKFTTAGTMGGLDYRLSDNVAAGVMFSYAHTDADLDSEGSTSDINSYAPGVYGTYFDGPVYLNSAFSWSRNTYSSDRNVVFAGINRTAHSDTSGNQYALNTDGGYDFKISHFNVGPTAALDYVHLDVDGFTETGADAADLTVKSQEADSLRSRLGTRLNRPFAVKGMTMVPEIRAAWQHEYLDDSSDITAQFSDPSTAFFTVHTTNPSRDSALLGAGLTAQVTKTVDLYLNYDAQVGQKNFFAQGVQGGGRIRF